MDRKTSADFCIKIGKIIFLVGKSPGISLAAVLLLILYPTCFSLAQLGKTHGERIVVCMIQLEHADAEELAAVLQPLLSPAGSIVPYRPTNTLIIKDRASRVEQLAIAIKGKPCAPIADPPRD
jgi:type II secretory pathway component GspD/PulD (secretin)